MQVGIIGGVANVSVYLFHQRNASNLRMNLARMMMNAEKGELVVGKLKFFFIIIAFLGKEFLNVDLNTLSRL